MSDRSEAWRRASTTIAEAGRNRDIHHPDRATIETVIATMNDTPDQYRRWLLSGTFTLGPIPVTDDQYAVWFRLISGEQTPPVNHTDPHTPNI